MSITEKLTTIANNMQGVYEKGYADGQAQGVGDNYYDTFWDMVQQNGKRTDYRSGFRNWYGNNWKPKYDLIITHGGDMFNSFQNADGTSINLAELLEDVGVSLDFSRINGASSLVSFIAYSAISHMGTLDCSTVPGFTSAFINATNLQQLYIKIKEDGTTTFNNSFTGTINLTDFKIVSGKIGQNFDISPAKNLLKTSIESIINALLDSASGKTVTFSKTAVNNAFGIDVDDETTFPEGSEYYELRNSKSNWTFNYA